MEQNNHTVGRKQEAIFLGFPRKGSIKREYFNISIHLTFQLDQRVVKNRTLSDAEKRIMINHCCENVKIWSGIGVRKLQKVSCEYNVNTSL